MIGQFLEESRQTVHFYSILGRTGSRELSAKQFEKEKENKQKKKTKTTTTVTSRKVYNIRLARKRYSAGNNSPVFCPCITYGHHDLLSYKSTLR